MVAATAPIIIKSFFSPSRICVKCSIVGLPTSFSNRLFFTFNFPLTNLTMKASALRTRLRTHTSAIRTNGEAAALEVHGRPKSKRPSLYTHLRTYTRARTHSQIYMYIHKNSARTQTYIFLFIYYSLLLSFFFYCNICIISIYICVAGARVCTHTNRISSRTVLVTCIIQCR